MNPFLKELTVIFLILTIKMSKLLMKTRPDAMFQKAKFLGHRILRQNCHRWREVWRQRTFSDVLKSHLTVVCFSARLARWRAKLPGTALPSWIRRGFSRESAFHGDCSAAGEYG